MRTAKSWARDRNYAKFRLTGFKQQLTALISSNIMTTEEKSNLKVALEAVKVLLSNWRKHNASSKRHYLRR